MKFTPLFVIVVCVFAPPAAWPQDDAKPFRWGADKTGGAPYLYDNANGRFVGFEVELAEYLAGELGRKSEFVQGDWSKLPELLDRGALLDVVMNGYEFDAELDRKYPGTIPYYIYSLALVARPDDESIRSWDDLRWKGKGPKKKVGVLTGSAAQRYLQREFGGDIDILANDDVANVYDLVARNQQLDATVQDSVSATYFLAKDYRGKLKRIGDTREPGYYVILTRSGDAELRGKVNEALREWIKDGTLRRIYEKYGLWNRDQGQLWYWADQKWPPGDDPEATVEEEEAAGSRWPGIFAKLFRAALTTVQLTLLSMPLAMLIGLLVALGRMYGPSVVRWLFTAYVEVIRGTPLLLQLYTLFYLLPRIIPFDLDAIGITPIWFAVLGLAVNYSAYEAENYRAGLLAVPRGQMEAALALGMTQTQALKTVIVPQAVRIVIPPVTNDFIALFKDTSVCAIILVSELTRQYNELYNGNRDIIVELAAITAGLYLLMSYPLSMLASRLENQSPASKV